MASINEASRVGWFDDDEASSFPLYLSYTSFAPQRSPSSSRLLDTAACRNHQTSYQPMQRPFCPVVPNIHGEQIHYPPPRLFRNQTPPSVSKDSSLALSPKPPSRRNSLDSFKDEPSSSNTKDPRKTRRPLYQLQNNKNTSLFDNGYRGTMEDVQRQIVNRYVLREPTSASVSTASQDCELELAFGSRQLSSLTVQSNLAPRAPGEDRSRERVSRGHNKPLHLFHDVQTQQKLRVLYDPLSSRFHQVDKEVPTTSSHQKNNKSPYPSTTGLVKSFVSTGSDDRSKSSQKTAKSLLSAKFAVVLPSRRSSSAIQPTGIIREPTAEEQEAKNRLTWFFSLSACLCILMIATAVLFVLFVPRGAAGTIRLPSRLRWHTEDSSFVSSKKERFENNLVVRN